MKVEMLGDEASRTKDQETVWAVREDIGDHEVEVEIVRFHREEDLLNAAMSLTHTGDPRCRHGGFWVRFEGGSVPGSMEEPVRVPAVSIWVSNADFSSALSTASSMIDYLRSRIETGDTRVPHKSMFSFHDNGVEAFRCDEDGRQS